MIWSPIALARDMRAFTRRVVKLLKSVRADDTMPAADDLQRAFERLRSEGEWSLSNEREHMENLVNQRFNIFLVFFALFVGAVLQAETSLIKSALLAFGFIVASLLLAAIQRAQFKFDIILKLLELDSSHPYTLVNELANGVSSTRAKSRRRLIALVPELCTYALAFASLYFFGASIRT